MGPTLLLPIFMVWAVACVVLGAVFLRRAPAVSLASFGSLLGSVVGFLVGNADGPAEVPAYTAVGASVGLFWTGLVAVLTTSARSSRDRFGGPRCSYSSPPPPPPRP